MNDETKAALAWIREMLGADRRPVARNLLAHIDGEPARLAAALENLREACARRFWDSTAAEHVRATPLDATPLEDENAALRAENERLRAQLLDIHDALHRACDGKVDLPHEIRTLRARVVELEREREGLLMGGVTVEARQQLDRAEKAEAQVAEAHERLDEFGMRRDGTTATLVEGISAMRTRIDEYRADWYRAEAQVAAARAACDRHRESPFMGTQAALSHVLRAMDEAKTGPR